MAPDIKQTRKVPTREVISFRYCTVIGKFKSWRSAKPNSDLRYSSYSREETKYVFRWKVFNKRADCFGSAFLRSSLRCKRQHLLRFRSRTPLDRLWYSLETSYLSSCSTSCPRRLLNLYDHLKTISLCRRFNCSRGGGNSNRIELPQNLTIHGEVQLPDLAIASDDLLHQFRRERTDRHVESSKKPIDI